MQKFTITAIVACLAVSAMDHAVQDVAPTPRTKSLLKWNGQWASSDELNRALGFVDAQSREDSVLEENQPVSFQLVLTETIGEGMDVNLLRTYRDQVFKRMNHQVVATGKWKLVFHEETGIDASDCFVTERDGETFLWVPANWVVIFGGRLSLLEGRDARHDAIVIDFNSDPHKERSFDTVAYQRQAK